MFRSKTLAPITVLAGVTALALAAPSPAAAERLVIPVTAHADGWLGSVWVSDVSWHNAGTVAVPLTVRFVPEGGGAPTSRTVTIPGRGTRSDADVLSSLFGLVSGSGAIVVDTDGTSAGKVAVDSRTYNRTLAGTFGQEVPAVGSEGWLAAGQRGVLFPAIDRTTTRVNGGVYASEASAATWRLLSDAGAVLAEREGVAYTADTATRYNDLIKSLFGPDAPAGSLVEVEVTAGRLVAWGSRVDNRTNDGDFALARRVRSNELPSLVGLDTGGDGNADVFDRNGDFELDQAIGLSSSALTPYELRLIATDPDGAPITWSAVEMPSVASLDPATGILRIWASISIGDTTVKVRMSDGTDSAVVTLKFTIY